MPGHSGALLTDLSAPLHIRENDLSEQLSKGHKPFTSNRDVIHAFFLGDALLCDPAAPVIPGDVFVRQAEIVTGREYSVDASSHKFTSSFGFRQWIRLMNLLSVPSTHHVAAEVVDSASPGAVDVDALEYFATPDGLNKASTTDSISPPRRGISKAASPVHHSSSRWGQGRTPVSAPATTDPFVLKDNAADESLTQTVLIKLCGVMVEMVQDSRVQHGVEPRASKRAVRQCLADLGLGSDVLPDDVFNVLFLESDSDKDGFLRETELRGLLESFGEFDG